jgi:hypothetical protein
VKRQRQSYSYSEVVQVCAGQSDTIIRQLNVGTGISWIADKAEECADPPGRSRRTSNHGPNVLGPCKSADLPLYAHHASASISSPSVHSARRPVIAERGTNPMRESIQQPEFVKEGRILAATAAPTSLHSQIFAVQSFFRPYTQHTRNAECLCSYGEWRIPQHIPTGNCYHFAGETSVVKGILVHTRIHDIPTMCGASPKSTSSFTHIDNLL